MEDDSKKEPTNREIVDALLRRKDMQMLALVDLLVKRGIISKEEAEKIRNS